MIVELAGLPGAGKTTFAKRLEAEGFTRVDIGGKGELLRLNVLFVLRYPVAFARSLLWLLRYLGPLGRWRLKIANLFFVHNAKYIKAGRYPKAVVDQGHFQNVMSLFDDTLPEETLRRYVAILPKPDMIVLFDVPKTEREARMEKRGYGVRGWEDATERDRWLHAAEANYAHLMRSRLDNAFPLTSVVLEGGDDKSVLYLLKRRIWYYVMNARMPTEKAHGLQIAKSCEALRRIGEPVALWVPRREGGDPSRVASYYGLRDAFPVREFRTPTFGGFPFSTPRFFLQSLVFLFALCFARLDREGIYVTRNAEIAWLLKLRGARTVVYEAHLFPLTKRGFLNSLLRRVDLIAANSSGTEAAFTEAGFSHTLVARNGVDLTHFFTDEGKENARQRLDLPRGRRIVLYSGSFYRWKGVPVLVSAWRRHFAARDDLLLVLVGGTKADLIREGAGNDFAALANLFLVPHVSAALVPSYLRAADILVLPTAPLTQEAVAFTSPIKLFEYMAAGRPVVASDLPSIREVVGGEEAVFVRAGDADDLAVKIQDLLNDPPRAERIAKAAREKAKGFDWETRARKIVAEVELRNA